MSNIEPGQIYAYRKVFTDRGGYLAYDKTSEGLPDPATKQVIQYKKGDVEIIFATPEQVAKINSLQGIDYVIETTPLTRLPEGVRINNWAFIIETYSDPQGSGGPIYIPVHLGPPIEPTEAEKQEGDEPAP